MSRLVMLFMWTMILGVLSMCANAQTPTWNVSPDGNDGWSGQLTAPNAEGTDGPLASLATAMEASRRQAGQPRRIVLSGGRYYVDKPIVLDSRDSGLTIEGAGAGQTIIYGGRKITGWRKEGDRFWVADVPGVKEGQWDFRALVVNDRLCPRARYPETGRLTHESNFPVRWMSTAGGGWERKPTQQELTTLQYKAGDIGPWLSVKNAEITVYHMWDESMIGLAAHDPQTRTLTFANPSGHPPGAFGVKTYVIWNVKEGMTKPGQWYLDRDEGRVVYWPLEGEDMETALVVAPTVETILDLQGKQGSPIRNLGLQALTLSTTTTPCKAGGFGASNYRGALQIGSCEGVLVTDIEVTNTAGHGIREWGTKDFVVRNCRLHHLGAGGLRAGGGNATIEGNQIHHVGLVYPSAVALMAGGGAGQYIIRRNEIHDTPYSGMANGGTNTLVEENLLYRCMQELHDGAAIYMGGGRGHILRRNVVRDIVQVGEGYGVSAYYLDEKCRDCVVERNVSIGVRRPSHNHMTVNCTVRDNVFIADGDMDLSFARSSGFRVIGNTLHLNGKLNVGDPDAIAEWSDNLIVQSGELTPAISDAMPTAARTLRDAPLYANVIPLTTPPTVDGKLDGEEWPAGGIGLAQLPDQRAARGAPVTAKLCATDNDLYVAVNVVSMYPEERKTGTQWGVDEGVEFAVQGRREDGSTVDYVLRGFTDGSFSSLPLAGATEVEANAFGQAVEYGASLDKTIWRCELRVPFAALRFIPADKAQLPLNITVYRSEDNQYLQWAGTSGETYDLQRGGRAMFRGPQTSAAPKPKPVATAAFVETPPTIDAAVTRAEWPGTELTLQEDPSGTPLSGKPCSAQLANDGKSLFVRLTVPIASREGIALGSEWRVSDGAEVCIRGRTSQGAAVTWVLHGFADGTLEGSTEAGAPEAAAKALAGVCTFRAAMGDAEWQALWEVPLEALGVAPGQKDIPFNLGVFRSKPGEWINWVGTQGPTWKLENAGLLTVEKAG